MLLHKDDPLVAVLRTHDEPLFLMDGDPTAEAIRPGDLRLCAVAGAESLAVRLWETPNPSPRTPFSAR